MSWLRAMKDGKNLPSAQEVKQVEQAPSAV